jgi:transcriptional repressor NrdR
MNCPFCHKPDSKVIDSRLSVEGELIRRRRECLVCARRFTTYERIDNILPMVIKKDGRREGFDRNKILSGLKKACEKRPVSLDAILKVIDDVEKALQEREAKEIPAEDIGNLVMLTLRNLDDVAYVRFASVYRSFRDVNEFVNEIQGLLKK